MTDYRVTFEYRERGRKARRCGSRVFKGYPNPEVVYRQMLSNLGFSSRVDELKIELKRLPAIKKARCICRRWRAVSVNSADLSATIDDGVILVI